MLLSESQRVFTVAVASIQVATPPRDSPSRTVFYAYFVDRGSCLRGARHFNFRGRRSRTLSPRVALSVQINSLCVYPKHTRGNEPLVITTAVPRLLQRPGTPSHRPLDLVIASLYPPRVLSPSNIGRGYLLCSTARGVQAGVYIQQDASSSLDSWNRESRRADRPCRANDGRAYPSP